MNTLSILISMLNGILPEDKLTCREGPSYWIAAMDTIRLSNDVPDHMIPTINAAVIYTVKRFRMNKDNGEDVRQLFCESAAKLLLKHATVDKVVDALNARGLKQWEKRNLGTLRHWMEDLAKDGID